MYMKVHVCPFHNMQNVKFHIN